MSKEVDALVNRFVSDIQVAVEVTVRKQVLEAIHGTLGGRKANRVAPVVLKGLKRSGNTLDALKDKIVATLKKTPGQRSEQLQKALGLDGNSLALPLRQLLDAKQLKCEGEARGRRYWVK